MGSVGKWCRQSYHTTRYGRRYVSVRFARHYDEWKTHEDYQGNLVRALSQVIPCENATVADLGTGAGQIAFRLAPLVKKVYGFDRAEGMIRYARQKALRSGVGNTDFQVASHKSVPLADATVDAALFGWSLTGAVADAWETDWRGVLSQALREAERITKPGGTVAVIETVNARNELPWGVVYHPVRRAFLDALEKEWRFEKLLFSNDWDYRSARDLRKAARFFVGWDIVRPMLAARTTTCEECAGVWWRRTPLKM